MSNYESILEAEQEKARQEADLLALQRTQPIKVPHILEHRHKRTCPECDGRGLKQTPIWQQFWDQPPEVCRELFNTTEQLRAWFKERNALVPLNDRRQDILLFPVSEVHCGQCRGTGLFPAK